MPGEVLPEAGGDDVVVTTRTDVVVVVEGSDVVVVVEFPDTVVVVVGAIVVDVVVVVGSVGGVEATAVLDIVDHETSRQSSSSVRLPRGVGVSLSSCHSSRNLGRLATTSEEHRESDSPKNSTA